MNVNIVDELQDQCANLEIDLVNAGNDIHRLRAALEAIKGGRCKMDDWAEYNCCPQCTGNAKIALEVLLEVFDTPSDPKPLSV